ncbi:hypothetical protein [Schlesneria paludicola]|uniref:hypothetical protein n=1 Tax=Schlesneria paludicola TaxID=360056 RepID=UPI001ED96742|nr:hypothetical protein [Schlesneria paludicola]
MVRPNTPALQVIPPEKPDSLVTNARDIARSVSDSSSSEIKTLRLAKWMTNGLQLLSFLDNLKSYSDYSAMSVSGLAGRGFVLTKEIQQAREAEQRSRRTLDEYQQFSRELSRKQLQFFRSSRDPRAASQVAFQLSSLVAELIKRRLEFENQMSRLLATVAEVNSKRGAALEILKDPHASMGLFMASVGTGELAMLLGAAEDFAKIRGALNSAVASINQMLSQMRCDEEFIRSWYEASISVCERDGVCNMPRATK